MAKLVGVSPHTPKGCGFDSQSGYIPRLSIRSLVRTHIGGNQWVFLSNIDGSLRLSPLTPTSSLSKVNEHILGWGFFLKVGLQLWAWRTVYSYIIYYCIIYLNYNCKPTFVHLVHVKSYCTSKTNTILCINYISIKDIAEWGRINKYSKKCQTQILWKDKVDLILCLHMKEQTG